jgi:hypothetical protein
MTTNAARQPIASAAAWVAADHADPSAWTYRLNAGERDEIRAALAQAKASGHALASLTREAFPLPTVAQRVREWARELATGRGFVLIRGFPVEGLSADDAGLAYYGLGLHWGNPVPQNAKGDLLGHVRDLGVPRTGPAVRLYTTRERQDFHTDGADLVGLLCLAPARSGGESQIASSIAVYNEIVRRRPDLAELLFQPMYWDRNDEQGPGEPGYFELPICSMMGERLRFFYIGWYIRDAQRHAEVPRLRPDQIELLDLIERTANDRGFRLDMDFAPGDIQFLNNAVILHARNAYEDYVELERKRHLLRLWLTAHDFSSVEGLLREGIPQRAERSAGGRA